MRNDKQKIITQTPYEAIRENPEWFIGTIENPTHLLIEVLDNSIDEIYSNNATYIKVKIDREKNLISITDDGRGIPNENDEPIAICTELFTSGKFKAIKKHNKYKISIGKHGVGLKVVNFLSLAMKVISNTNRKDTYQYIFKNGKFIKKDKIKKDIGKTFTKIVFKPDPSIFESLDIDINLIKERFRILKLYRPKSKLILVIDDKEEEIEFFHSKLDFYKKVLNITEENTYDVNFNIENKNGEYFELYLNFDFSYEKSFFKSNINLLPLNNGNHFKYIENIIKEVLGIKKLFFIKGFITLNIDSAAFSGQNKKELSITNKKLEFIFPSNKIKKLLIKNLKKIKIDNQDLLSFYKEKYNELLNKKDVKKILRKRKKNLTLNSLKFKDCKQNKNCILYIVEGDSAAGNISQIRDSNKEAIFPLKGKILNVEDSSIKKLIKNNEIMGLLHHINEYDIDKNHNIIRYNTNPKFEKIAILTDPDGDGYHIAFLIIKAFKELMPDIIEEKRLYYIKTPLYGAIKEKKNNRIFKIVKDISQIEKLKKEGYMIVRHKGLGEFNPQDLRKIIDDKHNWVLIEKDN